MRVLFLRMIGCFCGILGSLNSSELELLRRQTEDFSQFLEESLLLPPRSERIKFFYEKRFCRQILDTVEQSPAQLFNTTPLQLSRYLQKASQSYFDVGVLPEYHEIQTLSACARRVHRAQLPEIILELIELLKIKQLNWKIQQQLLFINNNSPIILSALEEQVQKISEMWRVQKIKWACQFFYDFTEKTHLQQIQQTIRALYMSQLADVLRAAQEALVAQKQEKGKQLEILEGKKILVFTCSYGTGHHMAASAIEEMLSSQGAQVVVHDLSVGALLGQDIWRMIFKTFGIYHEDRPLNSVDVFNMILKNQYYFIVNTQNKIDLFLRGMLNIPGKHGVAAPSSLLQNSWAKTQIRDLIFLERPDQLITSYHMDLNPILEVAEEFGIPVLHVPTDYDMKFWEVFNDTPPEYPHFKTLIPNHQVSRTQETLKPLSAKHMVQNVGIPLRAAFYQRLDDVGRLEYRQRLQIQPEEKILLISSGGNGQVLPHPTLLANSRTWHIPLRIEIIAGKNRSFVQELQRQFQSVGGESLLLKGTNPFVTIHILMNENAVNQDAEDAYFVGAETLSQLLDITDACVAKAGGLSVAELMFKGVPVIFDRRLTPFIWEQFNIDTVVQEGLGIENRDLKTLESDLQFILGLPPKRLSTQFYFPHAKETLGCAVQQQIAQASKLAMRDQAENDLATMTDQELDTNWKLNDYFGHVKVISSNPDSSRFQRCQREMQQIGLHTYEIVPGVNGALLDPELWQRADNWDANDTDWQKQGRMGCLMAHYQAILDSAERWEKACQKKEALQADPDPDVDQLQEIEQEIKTYSSLLMIEDNTGFGVVTGDQTATLLGCGRRWRQVAAALPAHWDMLYLVTMADNWGPSVQISQELVRLRYGVLTKCYAIQAPFYRVVLDHFEKTFRSLGTIAPVDHVLAALHREHRCYAPLGIGLAYRFGSTSEVQSSPGIIRNWQPAVTKLDDPI